MEVSFLGVNSATVGSSFAVGIVEDFFCSLKAAKSSEAVFISTEEPFDISRRLVDSKEGRKSELVVILVVVGFG